MSRSNILKKQLSLGDYNSDGNSSLSSIASTESEDVQSAERDVRRKKDRSHTLPQLDVQELRITNSHVANHSRDPTSPLKRFSQAKEDISRTFGLLRDHLLESREFVSGVHQGAESTPLTALVERTEGIIIILKRDHMKVAFFGRTSNGKSTVINSLLRETVLPAGIGHTTNCFCSVVGVDESEGYLIPPNSQQRQNVKNVKQLAHSLHKERLDTNSLVQIFWPKNKCPLLSGEVELMDSPGIDMDPDLDHWINKYCLDADVFVLVSNAESTLMTAEKKFFHRVSERLSKPNIFILNNRWDCSAQEEPDMMEEVKKQHLVADVNFLAHELAVVDETTAKDRVFFVSAKEVLRERTKQTRGVVEEEEGHGLPDGWKIRMMDFERFEKLFKQCISNSAIHTKFEQHYKQGSEVVHGLEELLNQELQDLTSKIGELQTKCREAEDRERFLSVEGEEVQNSCVKKVEASITEVKRKLEGVLEDADSRLLRVVMKEFKEEYIPNQLESYQLKLCTFIDEKRSEMLAGASSSLGRVHEEAKTHMIERYHSHLKLPLVDAARFYKLINPPQPSFAVKSSVQCEGFHADPKFSFMRWLGLHPNRLKSLYVETMVGGMTSKLSQLWALVPTEYTVPMLLVGGALLLPRIFNWRVVSMSLGVYGSIYAWGWSQHVPEVSVKKQVVKESKSKATYNATCKNYSEQMERDLQELLLGSLKEELNKEMKTVRDSIMVYANDLKKLQSFQNKAKILKNNTTLLRNDFEEFKCHHLHK